MLIVFSGLPGTGKTTIARTLARTTHALYLRIDTIEQAIRNCDVLAGDVGASGYRVANDVALNNLQLGSRVIVDCVNPVEESRTGWQDVASAAGVQLINVQVVCSDLAEHRRRVEVRASDVPGLLPPSWQSVLAHEYQAWEHAPFTIDTAQVSAAQAGDMILRQFFAASFQR